jgi:hypothetical protein
VYEGPDASSYDVSTNISIPVKQEVRFDIGDFEISPPSAEPGSDVNVMCDIHNTGKVKLYNVKASFSGGADGSEQYLGNISPGADASIDAMLIAGDTEGTAKVTMTLSYEDETGKVTETTKDFDLEVMAGMGMIDGKDGFIDVDGELPPEVGGGMKATLIPIIIGVVVIAAIVATILLLRRRKKKQAIIDEEALFDEMD